jgi:hypothetical protein
LPQMLVQILMIITAQFTGIARVIKNRVRIVIFIYNNFRVVTPTFFKIFLRLLITPLVSSNFSYIFQAVNNIKIIYLINPNVKQLFQSIGDDIYQQYVHYYELFNIWIDEIYYLDIVY